jgi:hypothetical protein
MRLFRHRTSRDEGVAAVEFALILPVLALILFGVLEFGRVWSQYQVYQGAAREGARCAAVASTSECVVQDEITQSAAPYEWDDPADIEVLGGGGDANGCTDADRGKDVRVSWEQSLELNIPFWSNVTVTPTIKAVFRCE